MNVRREGDEEVGAGGGGGWDVEARWREQLTRSEE